MADHCLRRPAVVDLLPPVSSFIGGPNVAEMRPLLVPAPQAAGSWQRSDFSRGPAEAGDSPEPMRQPGRSVGGPGQEPVGVGHLAKLFHRVITKCSVVKFSG